MEYIKVSKKQLFVYQAIGCLILKREGEENNNKKTNINASSVAKQTEENGNKVDYKTVRKYLKQLKDLC